LAVLTLCCLQIWASGARILGGALPVTVAPAVAVPWFLCLFALVRIWIARVVARRIGARGIAGETGAGLFATFATLVAAVAAVARRRTLSVPALF